jgi:hypothetical protein
LHEVGLIGIFLQRRADLANRGVDDRARCQQRRLSPELLADLLPGDDVATFLGEQDERFKGMRSSFRGCPLRRSSKRAESSSEVAELVALQRHYKPRTTGQKTIALPASVVSNVTTPQELATFTHSLPKLYPLSIVRERSSGQDAFPRSFRNSKEIAWKHH